MTLSSLIRIIIYNMTRFLWDPKNRYLATKHGVRIKEIEHVVRNARRPWPEKIGDEKLMVWGHADEGAFVEVIYVLESSALDVDYTEADLLFADEDDAVYVFHARYLTEPEKRLYRKRSL
jgi:uncharacterized DUF497 family protein